MTKKTGQKQRAGKEKTEDSDLSNIGPKLRELRKMYGFSQRELAKRSGVTNGTISLIEQGQISPSIGSFKKVLEGFPVSFTDFLTIRLQPERKVFYARDELREIAGGSPISFRLVGKDTKNRKIQMMHERYEPGADTGEEMLSHNGEESGLVIEGKIVLTIGGETRVLSAGDAYYFDSRLPHRFRNMGESSCVIVSACSPPGF